VQRGNVNKKLIFLSYTIQMILTKSNYTHFNFHTGYSLSSKQKYIIYTVLLAAISSVALGILALKVMGGTHLGTLNHLGGLGKLGQLILIGGGSACCLAVSIFLIYRLVCFLKLKKEFFEAFTRERPFLDKLLRQINQETYTTLNKERTDLDFMPYPREAWFYILKKTDQGFSVDLYKKKGAVLWEAQLKELSKHGIMHVAEKKIKI
jgi:uncharacterized membrane protein YbaN (DUF454 family)